MRAAAFAAALVMLLIAPATVRAEDKAAARAAYAEGTKYYDLNQFEPALKAFEKAYWSYEEPAFLFNIAQCYRQLDKKPAAVKFYRSFLRKVPETPNRAEVERLIASLEAAIASEKAPARHVAPEPSPPVAPTPAPTVAPSVTATPPPSNGARGRTLRYTGLGVGAFGIVAIGLGGAFAGLAKSADDAYLRPANGIYSPSADANRSTYQTVEIASLAVGGAALVTGTVLYLVGRRR